MSEIEVTIQMLRINPIHNKWELHFKDKAEHYFSVFLDESQAKLIGEEMKRPYSVALADIAIVGIDFKVYKLESVIVDDLKGGVLNTRLTLQYNNKLFQLDCSAEKAIVLALREGVPILMEEKELKVKANQS